MLRTETRTAPGIHPSAIIDDTAILGSDVTIGPFTIIGPNVVVGESTRVGANVLIERDTTVGAGCSIHHGAVLGSDPQDLKYQGERTTLLIGDRTVIREYATLNRGTKAAGETVVGADCLIMAYAHVAHDCEIGDRVVLANGVAMGGHVVIGDWAILGGLCAIHQFARIGTHAFVGGASRITKDVPPFVKAAGNPLSLYGLNTVGLRRRGFTDETRAELKRAYRLFVASSYNVAQALQQARTQLADLPEVQVFVRFFETSERGVTL